jgi:hypothetical protein
VRLAVKGALARVISGKPDLNLPKSVGGRGESNVFNWLTMARRLQLQTQVSEVSLVRCLSWAIRRPVPVFHPRRSGVFL